MRYQPLDPGAATRLRSGSNGSYGPLWKTPATCTRPLRDVTDLAFSSLIDGLRARLARSLPGADAQLRMAPAYRRTDPAVSSIDGKDCREAGVLALLFPQDDTPTLVFIVRRDHLPNHAGQIAFPGGQHEGSETLRETALRETYEEVNLPPDEVDVLGALTPLYIPPSGFCVYPFVGAAPHEPDLRPTDEEVGAILRVPLPHLLDPSTVVCETWTLRGRQVEVPFFRVGGYKIWGATAMMLAELLALCRETLEESR